MTMMHVRKMRVRMRNGQVHMRMRMRFVARIVEVVRMLMMFVVAVPVRVLEPFVRVRMHVPLAHVQPDTQRHQGGSGPKSG